MVRLKLSRFITLNFTQPDHLCQLIQQYISCKLLRSLPALTVQPILEQIPVDQDLLAKAEAREIRLLSQLIGYVLGNIEDLHHLRDSEGHQRALAEVVRGDIGLLGAAEQLQVQVHHIISQSPYNTDLGYFAMYIRTALYVCT
mgnify:FL=1